MSLHLHSIQPKKGSRKAPKRIGRGLSKKGTTAGRGQKGQKARSGVGGLQLKGIRSIMLAQPKQRGFTSAKAKHEVVNVMDLDSHFSNGEIVNPKMLAKKGLIKGTGAPVKILGTGSIGKKLVIKGCAITESAKKKVIEAGGSIA